MYQKIQTFDLNEMRKNQFGKHVLGFIEKHFNDNFDPSMQMMGNNNGYGNNRRF